MTTTNAQRALRSPRAAKAAEGILKVTMSGAWITRAFMVNRFVEAGYCERLANDKADALIAINTDIVHPSRWEARGDLFGYGYGY